MKVVVTDGLKKAIGNSLTAPDTKLSALEADTLDHTQLLKWYRHSDEPRSLFEVLHSTRLILPSIPREEPIPKSPEFESMMAKLRLRQAEIEYQRLIKPKPEFQTLHEEDILSTLLAAQQTKEVKNQITTIVNILVSVASVAYAAWYWTGSSWGLQTVWRVLLMVLAGLLVLIAEVVVYMGYVRRVHEARTREQAKVEVKKVLERL